MKKLHLLFLIAIVMLSFNSNAQSCCKKPDGMQLLALNASFKAAHEAPLPLEYTAQKGSMIKFPTKGGADGNAFFIPADETSDKVLIVVHEWWGLNDYIKREAENLHTKLGGKVSIYAVDLYDGNVASDPDAAGKLMNSLTPERGEAIISGLLQKAGKGKKIASIGWCMGGSWSFTASRLAGKDAAGCVMYYGFPEKDAAKVKSGKADVLYNYGTKDNYIKSADVKAFGELVKSAGHKFIQHDFEAVHAFANPSNPHYDKAAAEEAGGYALAFLKQKLGVE
jgi:carboxymethylenebutenolidase